MRTAATLFLVTFAAFLAGPTNANECPVASGVCYTPDCTTVAGSCSLVTGTDLFQALVGYTGADGFYAISATCENGKDLSNAILASSLIKAEPEAGDPFPIIEVKDGEPLEPFSMKCGNKCFIYGGFSLTCNP